MWVVSSKLTSNDRVDRHFGYLLALVLSLAVVFVILKPLTTFQINQQQIALIDTTQSTQDKQATFISLEALLSSPLLYGAPLCTLWALVLLLLLALQAHYDSKDTTMYIECIKILIFLVLLLSVPIFYDGQNVVQRYRFSQLSDSFLWDARLLAADTALLGWLFPQGQVALWLDTHPTIGVTTVVGRMTAEILQTFYVSYYFWGNGLGVYLAYLYFYQHVWLTNTKSKDGRKRQHWRRIQMFASAWVGGFLFTFVINLIAPAVSPRIYMKDQYVNEIHGYVLCDALRSVVTTAASNTFSAFPSGHCGLSWLCPLLAHRMNYKAFRNITIVAAFLISIATIVMRYHYFMDFLAGFLIVGVGAWMGQFHTAAAYATAYSGGSETKGIEADEEGTEQDQDDREPLIKVSIDTAAVDSSNGPRIAGGGEDHSDEIEIVRRDSYDEEDVATPLKQLNGVVKLSNAPSIVPRQISATSKDRIE